DKRAGSPWHRDAHSDHSAWQPPSASRSRPRSGVPADAASELSHFSSRKAEAQPRDFPHSTVTGPFLVSHFAEEAGQSSSPRSRASSGGSPFLLASPPGTARPRAGAAGSPSADDVPDENEGGRREPAALAGRVHIAFAANVLDRTRGCRS